MQRPSDAIRLLLELFSVVFFFLLARERIQYNYHSSLSTLTSAQHDLTLGSEKKNSGTGKKSGKSPTQYFHLLSFFRLGLKLIPRVSLCFALFSLVVSVLSRMNDFTIFFVD